MSTDPAQWHERDGDDEPITPESDDGAEGIDPAGNAPEPGEGYTGAEPRPDLAGEAAPADVDDQRRQAWSGDDEEVEPG